MEGDLMREQTRCEAFFNANCACHLCGGRIVYSHYGRWTATGWQVDHDKPRAQGGTDHPSDLKAAHSACNARKGARSTSDVRSELTLDRLMRDLQRIERETRRTEATIRAQKQSMVLGVGLGAFIGAMVDEKDPIGGALLGGIGGAALSSFLR